MFESKDEWLPQRLSIVSNCGPHQSYIQDWTELIIFMNETHYSTNEGHLIVKI